MHSVNIRSANATIAGCCARILAPIIDALGDVVLKDWVQENTRSPNAMVDRITPRPTPDVAERVKAVSGWDDKAAVMGESFIQWVIEDNFIAGRPEWEKVGVEMVNSVQAYEEAKIRLLNATHSCIAWAGTLAGYLYIHEGTHDAEIRQMAYDYVTDDAIPVLLPCPIDLEKYRDVVLERFGNPTAGKLDVAFCPMAFDSKGAQWVQRDEPLANPYYGAAMLRCGEVKATLAPGERLAGGSGVDAAPAGRGGHHHG